MEMMPMDKRRVVKSRPRGDLVSPGRLRRKSERSTRRRIVHIDAGVSTAYEDREVNISTA